MKVTSGIPSMIYGGQADGRSNVVLSMLADVIASGKPVVYIDYEASFDQKWIDELLGPQIDQKGFIIGGERL